MEVQASRILLLWSYLAWTRHLVRVRKNDQCCCLLGVVPACSGHESSARRTDFYLDFPDGLTGHALLWGHQSGGAHVEMEFVL